MTWLIMSCSEPFSMTCTSEGCKSLSQVWACSCQTQRKDEGHTTKTGHLKLSQASTYALAHWRNFQIKNWSQKKLLHDFSCAMLRHSSRYWAASDSACNVFPRPISSAKRIRPSRRIPALTPCRNHPNKVRLWRKSLTLNLKCLILLDLKKNLDHPKIAIIFSVGRVDWMDTCHKGRKLRVICPSLPADTPSNLLVAVLLELHDPFDASPAQGET